MCSFCLYYYIVTISLSLGFSQLDNGCSLHLAQRWSQLLNIQLRRIPILSKESAPGLIMATGGPHNLLSAPLIQHVHERGNTNTLAACSVSSCLCCFAPVNQVCVGPFREHSTQCNDREQVHEPDFLSSRLVENIDFALFARFGRHFLPLVSLFLSLPAAARPLIK